MLIFSIYLGIVGSVSVVGSSEDSAISGTLVLSQSDPGSPVYISGDIVGLTPGFHGFHVHEIGDTSEGCKAAGSHFNPHEQTHGAPNDTVRHVGDLGDIFTEAGEDVTRVDIVDKVASLYTGKSNVLGRTIVIHAGMTLLNSSYGCALCSYNDAYFIIGEDDLGDGDDDESLKTGNAGGRVACGIIEEYDRGELRRLEETDELETPQYICTLPRDEGETCDRAIPETRFYYQESSRLCRKFVSNGCGGNRNNFKTYRDCTNFCGEFRGVVTFTEVVGNSKNPDIYGFVMMTQASPDLPVYITGEVAGMKPGRHGFHIHELGTTDDDCVASGSHYNPHGKTHGAPEDEVRHVGDLGNILTPEGGAHTEIDMVDHVLSLYGEHSVLDRTLVIHAGSSIELVSWIDYYVYSKFGIYILGEDDLGDGGDDGSLSTGNAGGRVACGILHGHPIARTGQVDLHSGSKIIFSQEGPDAPVVIDIDDPLPDGELGDDGRFEIKVAVADKEEDGCLNVRLSLYCSGQRYVILVLPKIGQQFGIRPWSCLRRCQ